MLAVHGEPQRGLLSNGYASLRNSVRARFFDPCEPLIKVGSLTLHAKQKSHVNDLRKRRVRTTSRTPCHSTAMVQRCTGNLHSILFLALQCLSTSPVKLVLLTYGFFCRTPTYKLTIPGQPSQRVNLSVFIHSIYGILKRATSKVLLQIDEKQSHRFRHVSGRVIHTYMWIDHQVRAGPKL